MAASSGSGEVSRKRTDLLGLGEVVAEPGFRLRKEEGVGLGGREGFWVACAKSSAKEGSLGWVVVDVLGNPRNWEVRSSYCVRRRED